MDKIKSHFNDRLRFRTPGVYHTHFPTRVYKKLDCANINDISLFISKKNSWFHEGEIKISYREAIATLIIPPGSTIIRPEKSHILGAMRTDEVYVEKIEFLGDDSLQVDDYICKSPTYGDITYTTGDTIKPEFPLDTNVSKTNTSGIHFFILKEQAKIYEV
uniref:Uncharacterized protein n=1 Tax=Borely moumouvirus TaxID=2712067 RepID=A0A6G6ACU1_9VIRU